MTACERMSRPHQARLMNPNLLYLAHKDSSVVIADARDSLRNREPYVASPCCQIKRTNVPLSGESQSGKNMTPPMQADFRPDALRLAISSATAL